MFPALTASLHICALSQLTPQYIVSWPRSCSARSGSPRRPIYLVRAAIRPLACLIRCSDAPLLRQHRPPWLACIGRTVAFCPTAVAAPRQSWESSLPCSAHGRRPDLYSEAGVSDSFFFNSESEGNLPTESAMTRKYGRRQRWHRRYCLVHRKSVRRVKSCRPQADRYLEDGVVGIRSAGHKSG